jgi:type VI secretion system secreted protein Hcp
MMPDLRSSKFSASVGDMFLAVKGARSGHIKGESTDVAHSGEIEVLSWSWGMQLKPSLGGGTTTGKASMHDLKIVKRVDSASTALMSALRSNEQIKEAVLTLRKSGTTQLEYLKITIEQGRVTSLNVEAGDRDGSAQLFEHVTFAFNKITIDYVPQGKDGQAGGGTQFSDSWGSDA